MRLSEDVPNSVVIAGKETQVGVSKENRSTTGIRVAGVTLVWKASDRLLPGFGGLCGRPDKDHFEPEGGHSSTGSKVGRSPKSAASVKPQSWD